MRWNEIVTEELSVVQLAKSYIMDIVTSLKAQGVTSITVQQLVDQLKTSPDFESVGVEDDLVSSAVSRVEGVSIEPDPTTGKMSVVWGVPSAGRQVDQKKAEKDDKSIRSAALRSAERNTEQ